MTTSQNGIFHGSIRENGKGGLYEDGNVYHLAKSSDLAAMKHTFRGHDFKSYINIKEKIFIYEKHAPEYAPERVFIFC